MNRSTQTAAPPETPRTCASGAGFATPRTLRRQRAIFWVITTAVLTLIGSPWYAPYLIG